MADSQRLALRKHILAQRDQLSLEEQQVKSRAIHERLWALAPFCKSKSILAYVNFRSEVETLSIIKRCLAQGMQVAVPLTLVAEKKLVAYLITNPENDLIPGYCDIPEPDPKRLVELAPDTIDTVLVPGSVFDPHGGRLGYGGGYYDRFLSGKAPQALRIALCYEMQIVDNVPVEAHDEAIHYLVTEGRTIHIGGEVQ